MGMSTPLGRTPKMKLVMVGNGMAGVRTLEELLKLAPGLDATAVARAASLHGVAVTPGTGYYAHGGGEDHIRLVFSALPPETLRQAVAAFAEGVAEVAQTRR